MIKQLIKLANHLDKKGLMKEADYLDRVISKYAEGESDDDLEDVITIDTDDGIYEKKIHRYKQKVDPVSRYRAMGYETDFRAKIDDIFDEYGQEALDYVDEKTKFSPKLKSSMSLEQEKMKDEYEKILEEEGLGEIKKSEVFDALGPYDPSLNDPDYAVGFKDDSASFLRDGEPVDSEIIGLSDDRYEYEKLGEEND